MNQELTLKTVRFCVKKLGKWTGILNDPNYGVLLRSCLCSYAPSLSMPSSSPSTSSHPKDRTSSCQTEFHTPNDCASPFDFSSSSPSPSPFPSPHVSINCSSAQNVCSNPLNSSISLLTGQTDVHSLCCIHGLPLLTTRFSLPSIVLSTTEP
jgi:hypothetical protein